MADSGAASGHQPVQIGQQARKHCCDENPGEQVAEPVDLDAGEDPSTTSKFFALGELVRVYGTSGDGLRLRSAPDLGSKILLVAPEDEVFILQDGPAESDGYRWWYLVHPFYEDQEGWAVERYLDTLLEN